MANAEIEIVGAAELPLVTDLYNEIFRPPHDIEFFRKRLRGRYNSVIMIAHVEKRPVAFSVGFELKPTVFFAWLTGVLPDYRRNGIASQLHEAQLGWAIEHEYHHIRMECHNAHRPILSLAIKTGFDIVGMRWDPDRTENLIIFEKQIADVS